MRGWAFLLLLATSCGVERGPIPPERAKDVRYLIRRLKDPNPYLRALAVDLLGAAGDLRAVDALIDMLSDGVGLNGSDNWVGGHAANALTRLTGRDFSADQGPWRAWWSAHRRELGE
jgi:hypothetical protein